MDERSVTLQQIDRPGLSASVTAVVSDAEGLVVSGHDHTNSVGPDSVGGGDHRYRLTVASEHVATLAEELHLELHDGRNGDTDVLGLLRTAFVTGLVTSGHDLLHWLRRAEIPCDFETV